MRAWGHAGERGEAGVAGRRGGEVVQQLRKVDVLAGGACLAKAGRLSGTELLGWWRGLGRRVRCVHALPFISLGWGGGMGAWCFAQHRFVSWGLCAYPWGASTCVGGRY